MNEIKIFENEEFGKVRTVIIDSEPYFVGKDIAEILGYAKPRNAIMSHVDADDKKDAPIQGDLGGTQNMTIINESGMYSLILSSKLESAKKFKKWVTSEILPTIRKTGGYVANDDLFIDTYLPTANEQTKLLFKSTLAVINDLNGRIEREKPLVDFANQVSSTSDLIDIESMAKLLCTEEVKIGRNRLFEWLRNNKILRTNNVPYQQYIDNGYFKVNEVTKKTPYGVKIFTKTYVTGKGQIYITQKIKSELGDNNAKNNRQAV